LYQSVDTQPSDSARPNPAFTQRYKKPLILGLAMASGLIAFALIYSKDAQTPSQITENLTTEASHKAYLKAIGEPNAALRRARLQDFLRIYPTDTRSFAAQAQLDVLNAYETRDWNYITKIAYENSLSHDIRLEALADYDERWGGDLLGGRGDDIENLRAIILDLPDLAPKPDRRLTVNNSPIPSHITGDRLVGEPRRGVIIRPAPTLPLPPAAQPNRQAVIIPPKVRRKVTPRYPRKALRRNIGALVVLRLNIDAKGKVRMTELVDVQAAKYEKDFIKAAERAALRTRFHPQTVDGKAVPVSGIEKRYRFRS